VDNRDEPGRFQRDIAVTTRFDLNANWLVKLEGHLIHGTGALDNPALNDAVERENLEDVDWGMLILKTTAYF
jgi:hypothetical protein